MGSTIEEALYSFLTADADLSALVGTRINPDVVPQAVTTWPVLYFEHQGGSNQPYLSGEPNDLYRDTFVFTAESPLRRDAARVRDRLAAMFGGVACRGLWRPDVYVWGAAVEDAAAVTVPPADASERHDRQATVTVTITWGRR